MTPPVLVDLNKDGTVDIVSSMYNATVAAFDGETYKMIWSYAFPNSETYSYVSNQLTMQFHYSTDLVSCSLIAIG